MSVTAKPLVNAQYVATSTTNYYQVPPGLNTIIDKCTLVNSSGSSVGVSIYLVPSGYGGGTDGSNVMANLAITAGTTLDYGVMQSQILGQNDAIWVVAATGSAVSIRISGRECSL